MSCPKPTFPTPKAITHADTVLATASVRLSLCPGQERELVLSCFIYRAGVIILNCIEGSERLSNSSKFEQLAKGEGKVCKKAV